MQLDPSRLHIRIYLANGLNRSIDPNKCVRTYVRYRRVERPAATSQQILCSENNDRKNSENDSRNVKETNQRLMISLIVQQENDIFLLLFVPCHLDSFAKSTLA